MKAVIVCLGIVVCVFALIEVGVLVEQNRNR